MIRYDFDVIARLVRIQNSSKDVNNPSSKYFVTLARNYYSNKAQGFRTMFLEFTMFNVGKYPLVDRLNKRAKPGDIVEVAGGIAPQHEYNGTWYPQELVARTFKVISLSTKRSNALHRQRVQQSQSQPANNTPQQNNPFANNGNTNQQHSPITNNGNASQQPVNNTPQQNNGNNNQQHSPVTNNGNASQQPNNSQKVNANNSNNANGNNNMFGNKSGSKKIKISDDDLPF